jgi:hypothetical protein
LAWFLVNRVSCFHQSQRPSRFCEFPDQHSPDNASPITWNIEGAAILAKRGMIIESGGLVVTRWARCETVSQILGEACRCPTSRPNWLRRSRSGSPWRRHEAHDSTRLMTRSSPRPQPCTTPRHLYFYAACLLIPPSSCWGAERKRWMEQLLFTAAH